MLRIAKGSGTSMQEVHILMGEYKRLKDLIGNIGKQNLGKGNGDMRTLMQNPKQIASKMN